MGMFDTVLVKKELIAPLVEPDILEAIQKDIEDGFLNFQTKDLENALFTYKIEEDKKLMVQKYDWVKDPDSKFGIKGEDRAYEWDTRTIEIQIYDWLGEVGEDDIFITFLLIFIKGEVEEIKVHKIERTPISLIKKRAKFYEERRKKIEATFEWKLWRFLGDAEWKIRKFFLPLTKKYDNFKTLLRKRFEEKFPDEMFNSWGHPPKD